MIVRIDYHTGNLCSVQHMISLPGSFASILDKKDQTVQAIKRMLPGVGSYGFGIGLLKITVLMDMLNGKKAGQKTTGFGISLVARLMAGPVKERVLQISVYK
jgi:imidazoleglycerol phosphate synthase glutamine amidotransferase subunit HisH